MMPTTGVYLQLSTPRVENTMGLTHTHTRDKLRFMRFEFDLGTGTKISFVHQSKLPSDIEHRLGKLVHGFGLSISSIVAMIDAYPSLKGKELAALAFVGILNDSLETASLNMLQAMRKINEARNRLN